MKSFLKTNTYKLCINFYKSFVFLSTIITLLLSFSPVSLPMVFVLKFILFGFLYVYFYIDIKMNQSLIFYQNFGLSKMKLFVVSYLFDCIITILIFKTIALF